LRGHQPSCCGCVNILELYVVNKKTKRVSSSMAHLQKYYEDKQVKPFLTDLAKALMLEQPEDPISFLIEHIVLKYRVSSNYFVFVPNPKFFVALSPFTHHRL
jgi:hypothetical protein